MLSGNKDSSDSKSPVGRPGGAGLDWGVEASRRGMFADNGKDGRRGALVPRLPSPRGAGWLRSWFRLGAAACVVVCTGCETISYGLRITHDGASIGVSHGDGKTVLSAEQGDERLDFNFHQKKS